MIRISLSQLVDRMNKCYFDVSLVVKVYLGRSRWGRKTRLSRYTEIIASPLYVIETKECISMSIVTHYDIISSKNVPVDLTSQL